MPSRGVAPFVHPTGNGSAGCQRVPSGGIVLATDCAARCEGAVEFLVAALGLRRVPVRLLGYLRVPAFAAEETGTLMRRYSDSFAKRAYQWTPADRHEGPIVIMSVSNPTSSTSVRWISWSTRPYPHVLVQLRVVRLVRDISFKQGSVKWSGDNSAAESEYSKEDNAGREGLLRDNDLAGKYLGERDGEDRTRSPA